MGVERDSVAELLKLLRRGQERLVAHELVAVCTFHISTGRFRNDASTLLSVSSPTVGWARANRSGNCAPMSKVPNPPIE